MNRQRSLAGIRPTSRHQQVPEHTAQQHAPRARPGGDCRWLRSLTGARTGDARRCFPRPRCRCPCANPVRRPGRRSRRSLRFRARTRRASIAARICRMYALLRTRARRLAGKPFLPRVELRTSLEPETRTRAKEPPAREDGKCITAHRNRRIPCHLVIGLRSHISTMPRLPSPLQEMPAEPARPAPATPAAHSGRLLATPPTTVV